MNLTKVQSEIVHILREGGVIVNHQKGGKTMGRVLDKDKNPFKNITEKSVRRLEKKGRIKKVNGQYVYQKLKDVTHDEKFPFACSYDGKQSYRVWDYTRGKAKYQFWKEVKKKIDATIPYSQIKATSDNGKQKSANKKRT